MRISPNNIPSAPTGNYQRPNGVKQMNNNGVVKGKRKGKTQPYDARKDIAQFYISDRLKEQLRDAASKIKIDPYQDDILKFRKEAAKLIVPLLPKDLLVALHEIGQHKGKPGINIQNLPVSIQDLCATPEDNVRPDKKNDFVSEAIHAAFAEVIGGNMAVQKHAVAEGSIKKLQHEPIEQIVPNEKITKVPDKYSLVQFIHNEDSNKLNVPDILIAFTLRGDDNARTVFLPADKIVNDLDDKLVDTLRKPIFIFSPEAGEEGEKTRGPILYKDRNGNDSICFHAEFEATSAYLGATKKEREEAENAIWTLRSYLTDKVQEMATISHQDGEMFISDNHRSLHGTFPFETSEGRKGVLGRWLQRSYLKDIPQQTQDEFLKRIKSLSPTPQVSLSGLEKAVNKPIAAPAA